MPDELKFRVFSPPQLPKPVGYSHLAEISGAMDPKQAFLAGLVHDIGRLAMARLPEPYQTQFQQLTEMGCEPFLIERVLSGCSHAEAGSRALKIWGFPEDFIEAVAHHHQPEKYQPSQ